MRKNVFGWAVSLCFTVSAFGQVKTTSIPMGDAVNKALQKIVLTDGDSRPFHVRISVSEPENPKSPYVGVIEEWWSSADQWRREVTGPEGLKQTIVVAGGKHSESDEGDYFPLWLRNFTSAAFEPIPEPAMWAASGLRIEQITMPNGDKSDACARSKSKIGSGEQATDAFTNVCFDGSGRLNFYGSPRYSMEFKDYRGFGKKQFSRRFVDHPEPGTELVGAVTVLEDLSKATGDADRFTLLKTDDDSVQSIPVSTPVLEQLSAGHAAIEWPKVHSGNVRGRLAMYVSADRNGDVREAWPLNSDNAGLEDPARAQVKEWKLKAATNKAGRHVQVDGGLGFAFETSIGDPIPDLNDSEVRALALSLPDPQWTENTLAPGTLIEVHISVDETGKLTGWGFPKAPPAAQGPLLNAVKDWKFRPLMRDGKAQYFHGTIQLRVR